MNPELDNDVVNLTKAIRQVESNKNPTAKGASGEFGYYQFMPSTWASSSQKYLGRQVPVEQATPAMQNEVAYKQVKEWKDAGYNPGQIASMWNAGPGKPNAYKEGWKGVNEYGVEYDTPAYAEKVARAYQATKQGNPGPGMQTPIQGGIPQLTGASVAQAGGQPPVSQETPAPDTRDFLQKTGDIVNSIFPGKQVGEAIGTLGGYGIAKVKDMFTGGNEAENYDLSAPTPLQTAGDVAQGALTVGTGGLGRTAGMLASKVLGKAVPALAPAKTALGTLGRTTAAGAGIGVAGGVAEGDDMGGIAQRGLVGGAIGGALGIPAAGLKAVSNLKNPASIIENRMKALNTLEDSYVTVRKVTNNATKQGIDPKKILAETDLLRNAVDDTGTIRTQNAMQELTDFIKPQENIIGRLLQREGQTLPIGEVERALKSAVRSSGLEGGALVRALKNVDDDVAGYLLKADKDGNIPLSLVHSAKVDKYANINYLNPESKRADKVIARALKQMVEKRMTNADVQGLNKELQAHYTVLNLLEKLDGKKVQGGKLGKYFAQTVGSVVGSHFGPLGAIAGAEAGGRILGKQMSSTFGRATGNTLQRSPAMDAALDLADKPPVRKLPVKDEATAFTDKLPVIDAGEPAVPQRLLRNSKLPEAEGPPNVYTPEKTQPIVEKVMSKPVTGSPKTVKGFPRDKTLKGEDSQVQEASIKKYVEQADKLKATYLKENGNIVNTDDARKLFSDVGYRGSNSAAVHEASSAVANDALDELIKKAPMGSHALLTAGSSGSGKTSVARGEMGDTFKDAAFVLDGNLSSVESARKKIAKAEAKGIKPTIAYVWRDPEEAWNDGIIDRMLGSGSSAGRVVPLKEFMSNLSGALNTTKKLSSDGIPTFAYINRTGQEPLEITLSAMNKLKIPDGLEKRLVDDTFRRARAEEITPEQYEALLAGVPHPSL